MKKLLILAKRHKVKTFLLVVLIALAGMFSYNKYLDYQNVQDMKQLLADFEQLERDLETETGEELTIESSCGSVGKFATSYACSITLIGNPESLISSSYIDSTNSYVQSHSKCEVLYGGRDSFKNALNCNIHIRQANKNRAESVFLAYDESPNSPY
jgi:hypothetical protein